jgi:hypothetical protein
MSVAPFLPQLWLLVHGLLAAAPVAVYLAHRQRWRISLAGCFVCLTASGLAAFWLGLILRQYGAAACLQFLLHSRTLLTAAIVFVASCLITLVVWARSRVKTGGE